MWVVREDHDEYDYEIFNLFNLLFTQGLLVATSENVHSLRKKEKTKNAGKSFMSEFYPHGFLRNKFSFYTDKCANMKMRTESTVGVKAESSSTIMAGTYEIELILSTDVALVVCTSVNTVSSVEDNRNDKDGDKISSHEYRNDDTNLQDIKNVVKIKSDSETSNEALKQFLLFSNVCLHHN